MSPNGTTTGGWVVAVARALEAAGIDSGALCSSADIKLEQAFDPNSRFPVESTARLLRLSADATENEAFGLEVAKFVKPTTFHALGFSIWASSSLREVIDRLVRYTPVITSGGWMSSVQDNGKLYLRFNVRKNREGKSVIAEQSLDALCATVISLCRELRGEHYVPLSVHFERDQPVDPAPWMNYFRCPVVFNASSTGIVFCCRSLGISLPTGNPELASQSETIIADYLSRLEKSDIVTQVRQAVAALLAEGVPSQDSIAAMLCMSSRQLQRRLSQRDTSFTELVETLRYDLACNYLGQSHLGLSEIAFMLGFSSLSAFSRAFKRWTSMSPGLYRSERLAGSL
ncbi:AraC family transcriptional regulator [Marinobacterium jannaschii]|uniref:AraC family transcriptional regulator n=1 Tax=Marinobacterium jannaschii TaxID=64970 RepID=UPI000685F32E|nr:AraC family transcriptional regulator [Marinobacterium jannaschii]